MWQESEEKVAGDTGVTKQKYFQFSSWDVSVCFDNLMQKLALKMPTPVSFVNENFVPDYICR